MRIDRHCQYPAWLHSLRLAAVLVTLHLLLGLSLLGAGGSGGSAAIEGRVRHAITGDYLNNARVSVKGTDRVVLTDEAGMYQLSDLPPGSIVLRVFFTGFEEQEITVQVRAGQVVSRDFNMSSRTRAAESDEAIKLDTFVVQSTRETDAAAIAVNEQRFSRSQMSVVSADQFGTIPDGNPGELMKWLPGVSVEYFANNIIGVSVRGLDAASTEISFDGMPVASASTATASIQGRDRNFEMMGASSADIARIEVRKLRTPHDSANALGGSLNLVRRSAFEAGARRLTFNTLFTTDASNLSLGRRPGIRDTMTNGWRPNFKLTWTDPVSKTFGYAVTLNHNDVLARVHWSSPTWNFGNAAQAASAEARIAAGQKLTTVSVYNPQLTQDLLHDNPKQDITDSASVKFDWRPRRELKLSYSVSASQYQERTGDDLRFLWNAGNQTGANLDAPFGSPGTNGIASDGSYATYGNLGTGTIRADMREAWRNGIKHMWTNAVESQWRRGDWTLSARGSYSTSKHIFRDTEDGFFNSTTYNGATLPNVGIGTGSANPRRITVNLLQRDYKMSHEIRAYDTPTGATAPGAELDWQDLSNLYIGGAVSRPAHTSESIVALRLFAKRDFRTRNPFAIQVGFDFDERFRNVQKYDAKMWSFIGADGLAGTQDDNAAQIAAVNVKPVRDDYYDTPAVPRVSLRRLYDLFVAHPSWFQYRDAESYRFSTTEPYELTETVIAPYVEFTGSVLRNRLAYVGGVRYENVETTGVGSRDNGSRSTVGITDPLQAAMVRYVRKGASGSGGNYGFFPSFETSYSLTGDLILRTGYAKTQARNRLGRSVIPSSSFDSTPVTTGNYAGIALGSVNRPNPNLKPWTADNYEAHLEYYTPQGGVISVGTFRKDIDRVQVQTTVLLDTQEKLAELDLESSFMNFQSTTWINQGVGRIDGAECEIRQPLDILLPGFARGFTFTGSYNYNYLSKFNYSNGNISGDFQNFYESQYKGSLSFRRNRLSATIGVIRNGKVYRQRDDAAGHVGHRFYPPYTTVDFSVEFGVNRWAKLFLSGRNITNAQKMRLRVVDGAPAWSTFHIANNLGVTYTAGVSGSF